MLKTIKDTLIDYISIGVIVSIITALIRPYISFRQLVRDIAISFVFSTLAGLMLEYLDIAFAVKAGLSGVCGLFGVRLYEIADAILLHIQNHPSDVLKKLDKND